MKNVDKVRLDMSVCPFCGKLPNLEPVTSRGYYIIRCNNRCCNVRPCTGIEIDPSKLLEVWNANYRLLGR